MTSNLSAFDFIQERSEATPGLFNRFLSALSANIAAVDSNATINLSGATLSIGSSVSIGRDLWVKGSITVGVEPSAATRTAVNIGVRSDTSDYLYFTDEAALRSNYIIGSHVGGTADGLNIYDASGQTMIASFSKQSIRFYQNVVGPVFDVGGALADTLNAATFGTGADSDESRIQSAINQASIDGISRVYVPASMYPYSASSMSFIHTVQMVREGGNWSVYDVRAYGASGDSAAVDTDAIMGAISGASQAGGGQIEFTGGTYYLGSHGTNYVAFDLPIAQNLSFVGGPANLLIHTEGGTTGFFRLTNPENILFQGLHFRDSGSDISGDPGSGAICMRLQGSGATAFHGGFRVIGCEADAAWAFFLCGTGGSLQPSRIRDITISNCIARYCYYGVNCQENGDGLRGDLRTEHTRRAYFVYGVTDHSFEVSSYHDGSGFGADTHCLIKRYGQDTKNIHLRARLFGSGAQYNNMVTLEHQRTASTGTSNIEDIDLDIHLSEDLANSALRPLLFRSYTEAGVEETSTTTNHWDRISFRGSIGSRIQGVAPIVMGCTQAVEGRLYLDPSLYASSLTRPHYPGFVVRTAHDREFRTLSGNLTTQTVTIPLSGLNGMPFTLASRVYAHDDTANVAAQNSSFQEDVIVGYNAAGGAVVLQSVTNIYKIVQGIDSGVSYAASGENVVVSFSGAPYTAASGIARVETQYIGRGPAY